jgi:hypothetical protein
LDAFPFSWQLNAEPTDFSGWIKDLDVCQRHDWMVFLDELKLFDWLMKEKLQHVRYWMIVVSRDHCKRGEEQGFAQACHGRKGWLSKPSPGDGVVFYSSKRYFEQKDGPKVKGNELQKFTGIGEFTDGDLLVVNDFHRRPVKFVQNPIEVEIKPILEKLSFVKDKQKWGIEVRNGMREIPKIDFEYIQRLMVPKSIKSDEKIEIKQE